MDKIDLHSNGFAGIHIAMVACYDSTGRIDSQTVKRLTRHLIERGVQGLYVGGGTGEGLLHSTEERMRTLEAVMEENAGEITVTAHIGAASTEESVKLAKHAERMHADAISSIPPFYYTYSEEAVKAHWFSMMDQCSLPFFIYHIPSSTGFEMSTDFLKELMSHQRLMGIKMTTFNTYDIQQFKSIGGEGFHIFNGPDQQYIAARMMGATAGIGGTYGAMPELFVQLEREFSQGQLAKAQRLQRVINEIITEIRAMGLFAAVKALTRLQGVDTGDPRLPLPKLKATDAQAVQQLHDKIIRYTKELTEKYEISSKE